MVGEVRISDVGGGRSDNMRRGGGGSWRCERLWLKKRE